MIFEIWSATDRVYCNFGPFFCPFTPLTTHKPKFWKKRNPENIIILYKSTKNAIHMMYGSWDKKHNRENFLPFLGQFLPFYLTNNMKNQIFKKWKKCMEISSFYTSAPKIMIICYTVAEIQCVMDVMFIFHFGLFFVLLPPLRYHHFTYCNKNYNHMIHSFWDMVHDRWKDGQTDG